MANLNELNKIARQRGKIVAKAESGLLSKAESLDSKFYTYVVNSFLPNLDIKNGKVVNSTSNLKQVNTAQGLRKFVKDIVDFALRGYYLEQFETLTSQTSKYFSMFNPSKAIEQSVTDRGRLIVDGFIDSLFSNNTIVSKVQTTLRNGIVSGQEIGTLSELLSDQIKGKEQKFGLIKSFHYGNGFDEMQKYSRSLDNDYSSALQLNYAIYQGGEIKTTREFCEERNGKVFNREEIISWNDLEWTGKIQNGDVLIDCGGYNCRHDLDWVSYELAKRIDPSITKSEFDK